MTPMAYPGLVGVFAGVEPEHVPAATTATDPRVVQSLDPFEAVIASDKDALATTRVVQAEPARPERRRADVLLDVAGGDAHGLPEPARRRVRHGARRRRLDRVPQKQRLSVRAKAARSLAGWPLPHIRRATRRGACSATASGSWCSSAWPTRSPTATPSTRSSAARPSTTTARVKVGYTAPSVDGQAAAVVAGARPRRRRRRRRIGYVEAHGTATPLGDPIEVAALTTAYRQFTDRAGFCAIGSVKTNVGHLDRAAGVTGLIKASLAVEHGVDPGHAALRDARTRRWTCRTARSTSPTA